MTKLKLKNALSYSGVVSATQRQPFVVVEDKLTADKVLATGYFKVVEEAVKSPSVDPDKGKGKSKIEPPYAEAKTEEELKKLQKDELESIIVGFDGDMASVKNNEERVALILKLQTEAGL